MATKRWRGDAVAVAQVNTVTVGGVAAASQVYTVTINGKTVSYVAAGGDTNNAIAAALQALLAASTILEFAEVAWTVSTNVVAGTAKTAGYPFANSSSASGTGTLVTATTVAATGPNHWDNPANWSPANVPVAADDAIVENGAVSVLYGLAQSAVTLASLAIKQNFTGYVGLPQRNAAGYDEYRATYLAVGATTVSLGQGDGTGSGRIKLDTGSAACTLDVVNTGAPAEVGVESLLWKGSHASNAANVFAGTAGLCALAGETGAVTNLRVNGGVVNCGSGLTLANKDQSDGTLATNANIGASCNQNGGTHFHRNGTLASAKIDGGTLHYASPNNVTQLDVGSGGTADFSLDSRSLTCIACNLYAGATLRDPYGRVSWTNGIDLERCSLADVSLDLGFHKKLTTGAPT